MAESGHSKKVEIRTVFAAGDLAYDRGTAEEFHRCYDATWGKFKGRTRPALGNHEYYSQGGKVYFEYWGERAGPAGKGYYSYELGNWHVVVLNTNCAAPGVGGCGAGSDQEKWLREDLAIHSNSCIVAYGHHALYSSGVFKSHAIHPELRELWRDLGKSHDPLGTLLPNSEVRNSDSFGVLKLTLSPGEYTWEYIPVNGEEGFHDSGSGMCHAAAAGERK